MLNVESEMPDLKNWIEAQVGMVSPDLGISNRTAKGIAYITFTCGGEQKVGFPPAILCMTKEIAEKYFQQAFLMYLDQLRIIGPSILHWRKFPEWIVVGDRGWIYSRLIVTKVNDARSRD